jgi:hypothetical protein
LVIYGDGAFFVDLHILPGLLASITGIDIYLS